MKKIILVNQAEIADTYKGKMPKSQYYSLEKRQWLPVISSTIFASEIAFLIGKAMGDGHLDKRFVVSFVGEYTEMLNLKSHIFSTFGINYSKMPIVARKVKGISYRLAVHDCLFGRILFRLGTPQGNKTNQSFLIPNWIMSNRKSRIMFLRGILEDELSTIKIEKSNYSTQPRLKLAKHANYLQNLEYFLSQVISILNFEGVDCTNIRRNRSLKKDQKTEELYFNIKRNKGNIIRFGDRIGFRFHTVKQQYLKDCIKILRKTKYVRRPYIDTLKILRLYEAGYSIRKIGKIINLNATSVHRVISKDKMRGT